MVELFLKDILHKKLFDLTDDLKASLNEDFPSLEWYVNDLNNNSVEVFVKAKNGSSEIVKATISPHGVT